MKSAALLETENTLDTPKAPPDYRCKPYTRVLLPEDWKDFRNIRLEALEKEGCYFAASYEREKNLPEKQWKDWCTESLDHCAIGLFDGDKLIGITMVLTWDEDTTGQTALFGRSYIKPEYRRKGLSALLYSARLEWAKKQSRFYMGVVFHRAGNFISKKVNERHGARFWFERPLRWADGSTDTALWYRVRLKPVEPEPF